mmetsp:Transcript_14284/g.29244  ORF Transcript_14284/g.29244 Transcript_14284/m.29244 type:complete len:126 (-) Transcript_14284:2973-3350(-)
MLLRLRWVCIRGMARAGRGKGGSVGGGGASGPVLETGWGALRVRNSEEVPRLMAPEEYPDWLWRLQDRPPTRMELERRAVRAFEEGGVEAVVQNMTERDIQQLLKLDNRKRIKESNQRKGGGASS